MTRRPLRRLAIVVGLAVIAIAPIQQAMPAAGPVFSDSGPNAEAYGAARGFPTQHGGALLPQVFMVGDYSHYDTLWPSHLVAKASVPSQLRRASDEITLRYRFQGSKYSLDDYLDRNPTTGLLIARGDTILFEHYRYARTDRDRFLSQSMAKTITSMLVGIAVSEGAIHSIDDPAADYVPELTGTEYGKTPIRALLHMSSGVAFREVYDGADDSAGLGTMLFTGNVAPAAALAIFNHRDAPPGTRFHYAGAETEVLGLIVSHAVHMSLADYLQRRIWQPMGAEADARWVVDASGQEVAYCCFNATLRDWARFALMLAQDGAWNNQQIVPRQWLLDATSVQAPPFAPYAATSYYGYGYQVWLLPGARRQFVLLGIHGQAIYVDPVSRLVMVHTAVRLKAAGDPGTKEAAALWLALVAAYGGQ